jgi:hypothetical protein
MEEQTYPSREVLVSCGVMILTAGFFITFLGIVAAVIIFWS